MSIRLRVIVIRVPVVAARPAPRSAVPLVSRTWSSVRLAPTSTFTLPPFPSAVEVAAPLAIVTCEIVTVWSAPTLKIRELLPSPVIDVVAALAPVIVTALFTKS